MTEATTETAEAAERRRGFEVTVNNDPVRLTDHHLTGDQIKAAAIAQRVPIQADFVLSEVLPGGEQKLIPNDREVEVREGEVFWAIPGDDNS